MSQRRNLLREYPAIWITLALLLALGAYTVITLVISVDRGVRGAHASSRQVVIYCSADQDVSEPILAEFERRHPSIKVLARYDSEAGKTVGLVQRLRTEAARPVADVFWSNEVFHTIRLANEGLLEDGMAERFADWPKDMTDAKGRWLGFAARARVVVYNTRRVTAAEAPKSLEDLLDAKWRGRIVMASPTAGTTGGHVASWLVHYGPARFDEILQALRANQVRLVSGNSTVVKLVGRGEADIGLTDTDDVYAGQRNGWPVAMNFLAHGDGGTLVIPNTVALVKGGPHQGAAHVLMTFLLSGEVETLLAKSDAHNTPILPEVAKQFPDYAIERRLEIDYRAVADAIPQAVTAADKLLN